MSAANSAKSSVDNYVCLNPSIFILWSMRTCICAASLGHIASSLAPSASSPSGADALKLSPANQSRLPPLSPHSSLNSRDTGSAVSSVLPYRRRESHAGSWNGKSSPQSLHDKRREKV